MASDITFSILIHILQRNIFGFQKMLQYLKKRFATENRVFEMPITNLLVTPLQKYLVGFALHYILQYILSAISLAK
jgi:hypothetical protein